ncbi:hypothetical protein D3C87_1934660 [compost metagenome]
MPKYVTLSPLRHDGKLLKVGSSIELEEEEAAPLLDCWAIEPAGTKLSAKAEKVKE